MTNFDKTVRPQDDFFGYVNNNWIKKNPIPADQSQWRNFEVLNEKSTTAIKEIVHEISNTPDKDLSFDQKLLKNFFLTGINYPKFEKNHINTISSEIEKIYNIKSIDDLSNYIGYSHSIEIYPFWFNLIDLDDKDSKSHVMRIQQSGINLPNRDYYLENNSKMKSFRKKYFEYFKSASKTILELRDLNWENIYKIEYELAKLSWTDIQLRNVEKCYNKFTKNELINRFPSINWNQYFLGLDWKKPSDHIVVDQISFIDGVSKIFNSFSIDEIKQYLIWNFVNDTFRWVNDETAKVRFDFYGKVLSGRQENTPIWKRVIYLTDDLLIGELLGREYANRYFPESSKKEVLDMVEDIRKAYHKRIDRVNWMKLRTKKRAHIKLDNIRVFIGFPPKWHDFSKLKLTDNNHLLNIFLASKFDNDFSLAKIGKKPEKEDWHMFSHVVNAYHDPNQLVICFPAAILKPPFFDPNADYATNIGGIGAVIGHELTHGFDDQGSQFDEFGNVKQWLTAAEKQAFNKIAKNIITQANEYEVIPGLHLKGKLVIGEAIADIGGVELAIEALKAKNKNSDLNKELKKLFVNNAKCECGSQREEIIIQIVKSDPHPISKFRVNGVVPHVDDFYSTFNVTENDKLYIPPEKRAHIW